MELFMNFRITAIIPALLFSVQLIGIQRTVKHKVKVRNQTDKPIAVQHTIPSNTEAIIVAKLTSLAAPNDMRPLYKAILNDSASEIKKIIQSGININAEIDGKSPLLLAVLLKKTNAINTLVECGARINKNLVKYALKLHDINTALLLIKKGNLDINAIYNIYGQEESILLFACRSNDLKASVQLIKNGAKITTNDECILACNLANHLHSLDDEKITLIQYLVDYGFNINKLLEIWLRYSFGSNREKIAGLLIRNSANPNYEFKENLGYSPTGIELHGSRTPLFLAISHNCPKDVIEFLIDMGADINKKATSAYTPYNLVTPLAFAIEQGKSEIVALLIECGANL
jgi:ankyrin repeat protein